MDTKDAVSVPKPFMLHANFSDEVNRNIAQSEIECGVYLNDLSEARAIVDGITVTLQSPNGDGLGNAGPVHPKRNSW